MGTRVLPWQPNLENISKNCTNFSYEQKYKNQTYYSYVSLLITAKINVKKPQFKTRCKGDISHASKTAKITVFDPVICNTPDANLQDELLY